MLAKKNRLTTKEVEILFKTTRPKHFSLYSIRFYPNSSFKAAIITPKTLKLNALKRHVVKRRFYGVLQELSKNILIPQGEYIFLVSPVGATAPRETLYAEISRSLAH